MVEICLISLKSSENCREKVLFNWSDIFGVQTRRFSLTIVFRNREIEGRLCTNFEIKFCSCHNNRLLGTTLFFTMFRTLSTVPPILCERINMVFETRRVCTLRMSPLRWQLKTSECHSNLGGGNGLTNQYPPLALPAPSHIPLTWHSGTEVVTSELLRKGHGVGTLYRGNNVFFQTIGFMGIKKRRMLHRLKNLNLVAKCTKRLLHKRCKFGHYAFFSVKKPVIIKYLFIGAFCA
jgi:hypothetical protein